MPTKSTIHLPQKDESASSWIQENSMIALTFKTKQKWCSPNVCVQALRTWQPVPVSWLLPLRTLRHQVINPETALIERSHADILANDIRWGKKLESPRETVGGGWEERERLALDSRRKVKSSDVVAGSLATLWPAIRWEIENVPNECLEV